MRLGYFMLGFTVIFILALLILAALAGIGYVWWVYFPPAVKILLATAFLIGSVMADDCEKVGRKLLNRD